MKNPGGRGLPSSTYRCVNRILYARIDILLDRIEI
jgi:hypothetical protein